MVGRLLAEQRLLLLLIWDNFETVRSMPDPAGATAPLDAAGCGEMRAFLARLAANGKTAVIITSRTSEDGLSPVRRIPVSGARHPKSRSQDHQRAPLHRRIQRATRRAARP